MINITDHRKTVDFSKIKIDTWFINSNGHYGYKTGKDSAVFIRTSGIEAVNMYYNRSCIQLSHVEVQLDIYQ